MQVRHPCYGVLSAARRVFGPGPPGPPQSQGEDGHGRAPPGHTWGHRSHHADETSPPKNPPEKWPDLLPRQTPEPLAASGPVGQSSPRPERSRWDYPHSGQLPAFPPGGPCALPGLQYWHLSLESESGEPVGKSAPRARATRKGTTSIRVAPRRPRGAIRATLVREVPPSISARPPAGQSGSPRSGPSDPGGIVCTLDSFLLSRQGGLARCPGCSHGTGT